MKHLKVISKLSVVKASTDVFGAKKIANFLACAVKPSKDKCHDD